MTIARVFAPGAVANDQGDIFGNSPFRVTRWGKMIVEVARVAPACMMGWRVVEKTAAEADPDFGWIERAEAERAAL